YLRDDAVADEVFLAGGSDGHDGHAVGVAVAVLVGGLQVVGWLVGDGRGLPLGVRAVEVPRGDGVDDERADGGDHGDHAGEREALPRAADEARRAERLEGRGEDVHQARGEDDAAGEGLDGEEHVRLRLDRREPAAQGRQRRPDGAPGEDAEDGDDLEPQRLRLVPPRRVRRAVALRCRRVRRQVARRHQKEQDEHLGHRR
ncbi:Os05g0472850, partial [Oryza sativa Japonica Group]